MQQKRPHGPMDVRPPEYLTLLAVRRAVGISRGTLKQYLTSLGIEPICLHMSTHRFSLSREALARMKQLKQNPALFFRLKAEEGSEGDAYG
ncbi:MAG TPA: hypothetical protein VF458_09665 [Ktedonobacteraceae bacterium]